MDKSLVSCFLLDHGVMSNSSQPQMRGDKILPQASIYNQTVNLTYATSFGKYSMILLSVPIWTYFIQSKKHRLQYAQTVRWISWPLRRGRLWNSLPNEQLVLICRSSTTIVHIYLSEELCTSAVNVQNAWRYNKNLLYWYSHFSTE